MLARALLLAVLVQLAHYEWCARGMSGQANAALWTHMTDLLHNPRKVSDMRAFLKTVCWALLLTVGAAYKKAIVPSQLYTKRTWEHEFAVLHQS